MPFILSLFMSLVSCFFPFSALGEVKSVNCPCEKILEEKKCDNPDCIKICNLDFILNSTGQLIKKQCMEGMEEVKTFTLQEKKISKLEGFISDSKKEIKEIEEKNTEQLTKNCPGCHLTSNIIVQAIPKQKGENCDTYIQTDKYKKWEKMISKNEDICIQSQQSNSRNMQAKRLSKEEKEICELDKKYSVCCDTKYLNKTHEYLHGMKIGLRKGEICEEEQINEIESYLFEHVDGIMRGNKSRFSKKIYLECPDGCSFNFNQVSQIDKKNCAGNLVLRVTCAHRSKRKNLIIPVYDISIDYEGDIKCQ